MNQKRCSFSNAIGLALDFSPAPQAARNVAAAFGLDRGWLNAGPAALSRDLSAGWQARSKVVFQGKALQIRALAREDLLASKLFAFCDREKDFEDVLGMKPTKQELDKLFPWVLRRDASVYWPKHVGDSFSRLRKRLGYE